MKRMSWVIAATLPLLGAPALAGEKGEHHEKGEHPQCQTMTMSELPGPVQDTLKEESRGGKVEEICKMGDKGAEIFKAEIVHNGKGKDVELDAGGKVLKSGKSHDESKEHKGGEKY